MMRLLQLSSPDTYVDLTDTYLANLIFWDLWHYCRAGGLHMVWMISECRNAGRFSRRVLETEGSMF